MVSSQRIRSTGFPAAHTGNPSSGWSDGLTRVALSEEPPDRVILNATVFDSLTGEFLPNRSLWLKDGRIARVAPASDPVLPGAEVLDATGLTLVPGLIDGHTHLNRLFVPELVRALLPRGVTSVVVETMELAATAGLAGVHLIVDALREQPLRLYYTLPTLAALTEDEERAAPEPAALAELLADPACLGLGEAYWSNALLPGPQGRRVRDLIERTLAAGKVAEGHTAGARGARLEAYRALGVSSCHEPISPEEALEVYRMGFLVMIRQGGIRRDLRNLLPLFEKPLDFRRFALVTDSVDPERLATWGYLDQVVREALELGVPPHLVYRMASTNLAEHFRLEQQLGSLAPGRWADLVAIPAPEQFQPVFVMVGGELTYRDGEVLTCPRSVPVAPELLRTVRVDPDRALALAGRPPAWPPNGPVRAIEHVTNLVTREAHLLPGDADGEDVLPALAVERTRGEQAFWGLVKGFGLREGAYGTTMTWDSPDLVVLGRDTRSVRTALARLAETGGGGVLARDGEVVAEFKAPLCGVISLDPLAQVRGDLAALSSALHEHGVPWEDPLLAVDTLTTPAIPHLRLTHRGYVRLRDRALLAL